MKKIIVLKKSGDTVSVVNYILQNNNEYCSVTGTKINSLNKEDFVKLNLNKTKVIDLVNYFNNVFNVKYEIDFKWEVVEFWFDKTLLNKNITIGIKNGIPVTECLKEKHILPEHIENVDSKDMIELNIHKLKTVIDIKINAKPNGCLVGSFGYNVTDVVYKKDIDPVLYNHMEDALDDVIGTSLSYGVDFNSNSEYVLVIVDDTNYLFDFDDEIGCITNLHDEVVKCFSKGTNIRSYFITTKNDPNVLELINLNTGKVSYFDIDEIKEEIDDICDCPNCSKKEDLDDDEDKISRRIKEVVDNIFEVPTVVGGYVLLDSPNSDKCFEEFEDLKDYCVNNNIDVFKINENVTSYVKTLLGINYNYLRDKYGYTDKVKFYYTSNYFITGPKHITSKIKFKQLNIKP